MKNFYITTTLPYVNAEPHIGFALEIIQADVIARYQRKIGNNVFFNTGTDEHGVKIYRKSQEEGMEIQEYCDKNAVQFDKLKKALNLSYDNFIRTTDEFHVKAAIEFWNRSYKKGDIYKKNYKSKYCSGCELEKMDSELEDGKCPWHPNLDLEIIEEENYFFRFSKYQKELLELYKRKDYILPSEKVNEITSFVEGGLKDFSISRLKKKMPWGIPVPNDSDHVMYVWFEALVSYISTLGWPDDKKKFKQFWPGMQVLGKDNLRQQTAMWQAMLISAGLLNSNNFLVHGFISSGGQKMSKSLGNVVDPFEIVEKYGTDAIRYYLLKEIPTFKDGDFTIKRFEEVYNADLANGIGNLVSRVAVMINKYFDGNVPAASQKSSLELRNKNLDNFQIDIYMKNLWKLISEMDSVIEKEKPWELAKDNKEKLSNILGDLAQNIKGIAEQLEICLPETADKIKKIFQHKKIGDIKPLFPRL